LVKATVAELQNFVRGMGALRLLLFKANHSGSLIEGMVVYAAMADGLLRMGLVLQRQISQKTSDIDGILISQKSGTSFLTERTVYKLALSEGVIDQTLFETISSLYDRRNEVVHKFLLTNLTYEELPPTLEQYEVVFKHLYKIVYALEARQIELAVGMSAIDERPPSVRERGAFQEILKKVAPSESRTTGSVDGPPN
jgi:uncharacterized protein YutE (UPF0331/DUF86 family)